MTGQGLLGEATAPAGQVIYYWEDRDLMGRPTGAAKEAVLYPSMVTVRITPKEASDLIEPLPDHDGRLIKSKEMYLIQLVARNIGPGSSLDIDRKMVVIRGNIAIALVNAMRDASKDGLLEETINNMMDLILKSDDKKVVVPFSSYNEILAAFDIVGRLPESD